MPSRYEAIMASKLTALRCLTVTISRELSRVYCRSIFRYYMSNLSTAALTLPWAAVSARRFASLSPNPIPSSCVSCSANRCSGGTASAGGGTGGVGVVPPAPPPSSALKSRPPIFPPDEGAGGCCWPAPMDPQLKAPPLEEGGAPKPPIPAVPPIGGISPDCCSCCMDCCICIIACMLAGSIMRRSASGSDIICATCGLLCIIALTCGLLCIICCIIWGSCSICCTIGFCIICCICAGLILGMPPDPMPPIPPMPLMPPKGLPVGGGWVLEAGGAPQGLGKAEVLGAPVAQGLVLVAVVPLWP
mmetsp:Transcript_6946/g.11605  ORF Transcript_6946/g.11605 Transcript_6946/m.11605 type:complete len:303 (-) Transcript_6946:843-1751(-)